MQKLLYCVLSGISYLHAHKILHQDLTPTNLLVDIKNKIVKIADFGMAKEVDAPFDTHTTEVPVATFACIVSVVFISLIISSNSCYLAIGFFCLCNQP